MKKNQIGIFVGLKTKNALKILHDDIHSVVTEYEKKLRARSLWAPNGWLRDAFHHASPHTTLCWSSAIAMFVCGLALIFAACFQDDLRVALAQGLLVLILVAANSAIVAWDAWLRHMEIPRRVHSLLAHVKACMQRCQWREENYPQICSPYSPCITLQWTMRDGKLVNLPWALLVRGDLVEMRPGQQAPGNCKPANDDDDAPELQAREVYSPKVMNGENVEQEEELSVPKARTPLPSKLYILQETPYLTSLHEALILALQRPTSYHDKMRHLLMISTTEQLILPVILVISVFVGALRCAYLGPWVGSGQWAEMLLLQPVSICLPLLPLVFPAAWGALNCLGMARIQALFHNSTGKQPSNLEWKVDISTHSPSGVASDPFEESDEQSQAYVSWRQLWPLFVDFIRGRGAIPCRSANLLHVLGSVTALCCVDKKGILSWPNPTAEKVFFLRSSGPASCTSSMDSLKDSQMESRTEKEAENNCKETDEQNEEKSRKEEVIPGSPQTVAEVLDLTHDHASPFRLQFDDPGWRKHLSSLKPLGLSILLNTCNMSTQEHYTQFCSHVTCEAMHSEHLVPVTNRRYPSARGKYAVPPGDNKCLCELAKQIGFTEQAQDAFQLEQQLSTFRHVEPEMVRRDIKFARSLSLAKLKFPFPHMVAVVVRDKFSGGLQLLSQGTADIILDSCDEFWDGRDLCPLSPDDRRKVQDFYQRTSLTAYCTAFAYRPLSRFPSIQFSNMYLELPADSKALYALQSQRGSVSLDNESILSRPCRSQSEDSMKSPNSVSDVESCFELQCNQVFVGMVTMQYQAQTDMVQLIEQLERACIRFVHFSKENELRSRVFSEKMGLESGWNCHISLLSEHSSSGSGNSGSWHTSPAASAPPPSAAPRDSSHASLPRYAPTPPRRRHESAADESDNLIRERPLTTDSKNISFSAPSAINLDFSQVKFEEETEMQKKNREGWISEKKSSKDSMLVQSVDLTSHPDDACRSLSVLTDSTEQSAPVNFDMSNRAKLPRGIENIRPHLEHIDNVPLLVSLFTDCTPAATREMLSIMQEYGEVVCAIGSSANADNMPIFMQADASMAVEPLYPQVCQRVPVFSPVSPDHSPSPVELSKALNSVACSVSFLREDPISIFHLIMECRHFMQCITNSLQFWLSSSISISLVQIVATLVVLPPIFTTGQVLWMQCVVIPFLALALIGKPTDSYIMQRATGKNQCSITTELVPGCVTLLGLYAGALASLCPQLPGVQACAVLYPSAHREGASWRGWGDHQASLCTLQHAACLLHVIYLVVISVGFVHRESPIWTESPTNNHLWVLSVLLVLVLQLGFSALNLGLLVVEDRFPGLPDIPWLIYFLAGVSPIVVFCINELVKQQEIKASVRQQKKARLEFGTKLGMNSPF
ncbi:hypothetical protein B566_EDAN001068 [Ephemera danica]|nr:hypothetical protein B566_EDAN001068 [Ephemera danica]